MWLERGVEVHKPVVDGIEHVLAADPVAISVRQITEGVSQSLGGQLGTAQIELPSSGGNSVGGAEPVVNGLPDFTRDIELQLRPEYAA